GENNLGQVGDSSSAVKRLKPVKVQSTRLFRQVDAGYAHSCAVTRDYHAFCWGGNWTGQVGDGTTTDRRWPRAVRGGLSFRRVSAGMTHNCAETLNSRAYCWGENS